MHGRTLLHYVAYRMGLETASTQTTAREREALERNAVGKRAIVELGVFEGVSALVLRRAMEAEGRLWLIDPFTPGRLGVCWAKQIAKHEVAREGRGETIFVEKRSFEAARGWSTKVDMVFIDADHSYEAVSKDWVDWCPFVEVGGVVAFHDSRVFPGGWVRETDGPARVVREVLSSRDDFELAEVVDSLSILRRIR